MKKKILYFAYFCILLGGICGGIIIYAEQHPGSQVHKIVIDLGFHLKK